MNSDSSMFALALARLPHGPEFRFLDRIVALEPGKSGVGEFHLRGDESFLRGHFPGMPIMPGVLLVEAGAQLAGVVAQSDPVVQPLGDLRLAALRHVKINGSAIPGQTIRLEAKIISRLGPLIHAEARAYSGDQLLVAAEITLAGSATHGTRGAN